MTGPADRQERLNPERFPIDDQRVYDAYIAGRKSAAIAAAVRAGLFDLLAGGALPFDRIQTEMGWSRRGTRSMLDALIAMGFVVIAADGFSASADAAAYLTRGAEGSLWGLVDMEVDSFLSPAALLEALAKDKATVYGGEDPWAAHGADSVKARAFTAAMPLSSKGTNKMVFFTSQACKSCGKTSVKACRYFSAGFQMALMSTVLPQSIR